MGNAKVWIPIDVAANHSDACPKRLFQGLLKRFGCDLIAQDGMVFNRTLLRLLGILSVLAAVVVLDDGAMRSPVVGLVVAGTINSSVFRSLGIEEEQSVGDTALQQLADFVCLQRRKQSLALFNKSLQSVPPVLVLDFSQDWPNKVADFIVEALPATVTSINETLSALVELNKDLTELFF